MSIFNRQAGTWQTITPEFYDLLYTAKRLAADTDQLFNPFILPALQTAGYTKSFLPGHESDPHDDFSGRSVVPVSQLQLEGQQACIPYGTALDLGGLGKGYLLESLTGRLGDGLSGYWVSLGGDILCAGLTAKQQPWQVRVQSAASADQDIGVITMPIQPSAVATSGTTLRQGRTATGKPWHHIIDPRTLKPAETDISLASVCHSSATYADVLASCAVIVGSRRAPGLMQSFGIQQLIVQRPRRAPQVYGKNFAAFADSKRPGVTRHA